MSQGQLKSELTALLKNYQAKEKTLENEVFSMTERYQSLHSEFESSLRIREQLVEAMGNADTIAKSHIAKLTQQNAAIMEQMENERQQPASLQLAEEVADLRNQLKERAEQNKTLFADYQNMKFKHASEIEAVRAEKEAALRRCNDLSAKFSDMTIEAERARVKVRGSELERSDSKTLRCLPT